MTCPHELYVLRHGETEWNRQHRWQGRLDSPLTAHGMDQARALGLLLTDLGVTGQSHDLFTSPQGRAQATARLTFEEIGEAQVDERLAEIDVGAFAGLTREEIVARSGLGPNADMFDYYGAAPDGESFAALFARVDAFVADLKRPAVIVTHGITSRFLRAAALGWGLDRVREPPGGQGVVHRVRNGWHETLEA